MALIRTGGSSANKITTFYMYGRTGEHYTGMSAEGLPKKGTYNISSVAGTGAITAASSTISPLYANGVHGTGTPITLNTDTAYDFSNDSNCIGVAINLYIPSATGSDIYKIVID